MVNIISKMQADENNTDRGNVRIDVTNNVNRPISGATVTISYSNEPETTIEQTNTDISGQTETINLAAPPLELSLDVNNRTQPYSNYNVRVTAPGYEPAFVSDIEILADTSSDTAIQLTPIEVSREPTSIVVDPHTLYWEYPPKIAEDEIKPIEETGEIVLSRVVVPEFVIVHDGSPTDTSAPNYYVRYTDYIKNVASSEIYATWPEATIYANVLAIMSFTLNRVYTEWYRGKGFDFTVTSSTAFDQKWIKGRNIYDSISFIVDSVFTNYLARPNVRQPILTQYCDGNRVFCPNWLSQWGSKALGDDGYSAIEIIRNYYGDNMFISSAEQVSGVPSSWPGYNLDIGASGDKVRQMQEQLATIRDVYTAIPQLSADGNYGQQTADAVRAFQKIFNLPQTGIVDFATWYKISQIYVGVTRIAELA